VPWWMYLVAVIDMLNIGFNAREPRWDRMDAHVARVLGDGAGGFLPYSLIMNSSAASRLFSPDPHDPGRSPQPEVNSNFMRSK
jgi:hypothetical protein